jgi:hypothetical protein
MAGFLSLFLGVNVSGPFVDQRAGLEDTPSWGKFLKESLGFSEIEPTILKCLLKIRFLLWKM